MRAVILAAGRATRMEGVAPHGCKSLVPIGNRTVLDHQLAKLAGWDVTVVCHPSHVEHLERFPVRIGTDDSYGGPLSALKASGAEGLTLVIYADTLFDRVPACPGEWVGVGIGHGPRDWDAWTRDGWSRIELADLTSGAVCAGMYRLELGHRDWACESMPDLLNSRKGLRLASVDGWMDVGTKRAWAHATSLHAA